MIFATSTMIMGERVVTDHDSQLRIPGSQTPKCYVSIVWSNSMKNKPLGILKLGDLTILLVGGIFIKRPSLGQNKHPLSTLGDGLISPCKCGTPQLSGGQPLGIPTSSFP